MDSESEMVAEKLIDSIGKIIIYFNCDNLRFEGKILKVDNIWLKYYDTRKDKPRFIKLVDIHEFEVLDE